MTIPATYLHAAFPEFSQGAGGRKPAEKSKGQWRRAPWWHSPGWTLRHFKCKAESRFIDENKPKIVRSTSSILHSPEMHVIWVNSMDCYSNHPKRTSSILSMLQLHAFVVLGRHHVAVDNSHTVRIQPEDWNQTPWCSQSRVKHAMQPSKSMVFYLSHAQCETWSSFRTLLCSGGYMLCDFQIAHDDSECVWCRCWWWWWLWWWWCWMKVYITTGLPSKLL